MEKNTFETAITDEEELKRLFKSVEFYIDDLKNKPLITKNFLNNAVRLLKVYELLKRKHLKPSYFIFAVKNERMLREYLNNLTVFGYLTKRTINKEVYYSLNYI